MSFPLKNTTSLPSLYHYIIIYSVFSRSICIYVYLYIYIGTELLPLCGWDGSCEYIRAADSLEMPYSLNPIQGCIISANSKIIKNIDSKVYLGQVYKSAYRQQVIEEELAARVDRLKDRGGRKINMKDTKLLQNDDRTCVYMLYTLLSPYSLSSALSLSL